MHNYFLGLPWWLSGKESANVGDVSLTPGSGRFPGEGKSNQSSIFAWEIPRTEEPGRLQSVGLQRFGHDLARTILML